MVEVVPRLANVLLLSFASSVFFLEKRVSLQPVSVISIFSSTGVVLFCLVSNSIRDL